MSCSSQGDDLAAATQAASGLCAANGVDDVVPSGTDGGETNGASATASATDAAETGSDGTDDDGEDNSTDIADDADTETDTDDTDDDETLESGYVFQNLQSGGLADYQSLGDQHGYRCGHYNLSFTR